MPRMPETLTIKSLVDMPGTYRRSAKPEARARAVSNPRSRSGLTNLAVEPRHRGRRVRGGAERRGRGAVRVDEARDQEDVAHVGVQPAQEQLAVHVVQLAAQAQQR